MNIPIGANTLSTDFDLMRSVAGTMDTRNDEIRAMLQAFIGRMSGVPPSVWGGVAAARFKEGARFIHGSRGSETASMTRPTKLVRRLPGSR